MAVPEDIRKVARPVNTFVCDIDKHGRYPVREKIGCGYYVDAAGKRHRPSKNGKVIGHIVDGVYVPKSDKAGSIHTGEVDLKDWANICICDRENRDILEDLRRYYNEEDSQTIYAMAMLRALYRGMKDRLMERQYQETFLTEMYPGLKLDKNSVCRFMRDLGRQCSRITRFMRARVSMIESDDHLIIDGTLRQDQSTVNSLSEVSRNTVRTKHQDVLIMYGYSLNRKEVVCSEVFPGNMVDQRAVKSFLEDNGISKGLIVADKGFPPGAIVDGIRGTDVHYLLPLKRGSLKISENMMYEYDGTLSNGRRKLYKKVVTTDGDRTIWLYSFKDPEIAKDEELLYMEKHPGKLFDMEDFEEASKSFGTLVLESDAELEPEDADKAYEERWLVELAIRFDKDEKEMDDTREHSDYSVIGSNFINYLASIMSSRMLNLFESSGVLDKNTYGDVMRLLQRLKKTRVGNGEWQVRRIAKADIDEVQKMRLFDVPIVPSEPKKKPGRPKGSKDKVPRKRKSANAEPRDDRCMVPDSGKLCFIQKY
jgi:hypothetical protein